MSILFILIASFIFGTIIEMLAKTFGKTLDMQYTFHMPAPFLLGIPMMIIFGWCIILSISFFITNGIFMNKKISNISILLFSILDAYTATSLDTLLDPVGVKEGKWTYLQRGDYFGVPYKNFVFWFVGVLFFGLIMRASLYFFFKQSKVQKYTFYFALLIYTLLFCLGIYQAIQYKLFIVIIVSSILILMLLFPILQYFFKKR